MFYEFSLVERIMRWFAKWLLRVLQERAMSEFRYTTGQSEPAVVVEHKRYVCLFTNEQVEDETDRQLRDLLDNGS